MEIDTSEHLAATAREVRIERHDGDEMRIVVTRRAYTTTVDDLWDAVTTLERIPRWFLPISGELHVGGRYQFEGNAGGEVLTCDAPHHFAVTWEFGGGLTWVDVRLSPVADDPERTWLELTHRAPAGDLDQWEQFGPGAVGIGWESGLLGLGLHLASGAAVDTQAAMTWMGSPGGKAFVRTCSDGWGRASIAAGTDPAAAEAAAEQTRRAYTGELEPDDAATQAP